MSHPSVEEVVSERWSARDAGWADEQGLLHATTHPTASRLGRLDYRAPIDSDGDYFVLFDDFPCPVGEPEWCIHHTLLIPLDDDGYPVQSVTDSLVTS